MPLEALYDDEVKAMRERGLKLAEVSCLAVQRDSLDRKKRFEICVNLMGLMAQYARYHGIDRLLVACHPRHSHFYVDFLGFQLFGERKPYDSVNGNLAIGCYHDFEYLDRTSYRLRQCIYAVKHQPGRLSRKPMPPEEQEYFKPATMCATSGFLPAAA